MKKSIGKHGHKGLLRREKVSAEEEIGIGEGGRMESLHRLREGGTIQREKVNRIQKSAQLSRDFAFTTGGICALRSRPPLQERTLER